MIMEKMLRLIVCGALLTLSSAIFIRNFENLVQIPAGISTTVIDVDLADNIISSVVATDMAGFTNLESLVLSRNLLTRFPQFNAGVCATIQSLSMGDNDIKEIPADDLCMMPNLVSLGLGGNALTVFPDVRKLSALQTLILNHNQISCLPRRIIKGLTSLLTLKIIHNNLRSVSSLPCLLTNVYLIGNPLRCDRSLDWLARNSGIVASFTDSDVPCVEPAEYASTTWGEIKNGAIQIIDDLSERVYDLDAEETDECSDMLPLAVRSAVSCCVQCLSTPGCRGALYRRYNVESCLLKIDAGRDPGLVTVPAPADDYRTTVLRRRGNQPNCY